MKRIASQKTLNNNKKTRRSYAFDAMERDSMSGEKYLYIPADKAMDNFNSLNKDEMMRWALREQEYRQITC